MKHFLLLQVKSSFNTIGDVMGSKCSRMKIETYGAIQGVKYALRARKTTALELFKKTTKVEPVVRTMCRNIRSATWCCVPQEAQT